MSKGLQNRRERAAIARRMRNELARTSRADAKQEQFAGHLGLHLALGPIFAAAGGGALAWYRGGVPAWWQLTALVAIAVGTPLVHLLRNRHASHVRRMASK